MGAKIGGGVVRRNNEASATKPKSDLWYLGASYPLTPALTLDGQWSTLRYKTLTTATPRCCRRGWRMPCPNARWSTPRWGISANDKLAAVSASGGAAGGNPSAGGSQNGVIFGMRHAF